MPDPVIKGTRSAVGELSPVVVEFTYRPPLPASGAPPELPAVGCNPPVPGNSCALSGLGAVCIDATMSKVLFRLGSLCEDAPPVAGDAAGGDSVIVPSDVVLPARMTDGNSLSGGSGDVPKGGVEDDAGRDSDDVGRSAGVNLDVDEDRDADVDDEDSELDAAGGTGCVGLIAILVEFADETPSAQSLQSSRTSGHYGLRSKESLTLSPAKAFPPY